MHPNHALLDRLFDALNRHDHATMATCYAPDAYFRDIAFDLNGQDRIHGMWRMICSGDIKLSFQIIDADDREGTAQLVEDYTFGASKNPLRAGRRVRNNITSRFAFAEGRIRRQDDHCDPRAWASQALGDGIIGLLAGRIRWLRSRVAKSKLDKFLRESVHNH